MNNDANNASPSVKADSVAKATSELNNLLQIISGTSSLIEQASKSQPDSQPHFATLRTSVDRAGKVTAGLAKEAGGPDEQALVNPELAALGKKKAAVSAQKKGQWILVVDDEQATLGLVSRILIDADYLVTTAQSGFECLEYFRQRPYQFDLVLLDLTMPFMDGEETFDRLREIRPDMPVVICTGFIQHPRLHGLMARGLAGFLRKPCAPDEMLTHIRKILASMRYSRDTVDPHSLPAAL